MDRREFISATVPLAMLLAGCNARSERLAVGSKNFTEQLILGEIVALSLRRFTSLPIEDRFYLAGSYICQQAILAGRIDTYVEYTGTALTAILKEPPISDSRVVYQRVKDAYQTKFNLELMPPLGFNNSFAIVMRHDDAQRLGLKSLSDLAGAAPHLRMGVGYEFLERQDGYQGLVKRYGLKFTEAPRVMDLGLIYRALENRQVDLVAGSNTDGLIAALNLVVLQDDRGYFPPYDAVPIVRAQTLERHPEVRGVFERLAGKFSAEEMRHLNYSVDGRKQDAAAVAHGFLSTHNLV